MESLEALVNDPIIKLFIVVIVFFGVMDVFKTILGWVWKQLGGKDEDFR
tara:strand:+ start:308 stop:454 length:147 start_codon:yes stop_codon:yes gene_type:complete